MLDFPGDAVIKNPPTDARNVGSILGSGKYPGVGNSNPLPLQCSCLEKPMDGGA